MCVCVCVCVCVCFNPSTLHFYIQKHLFTFIIKCISLNFNVCHLEIHYIQVASGETEPETECFLFYQNY